MEADRPAQLFLSGPEPQRRPCFSLSCVGYPSLNYVLATNIAAARLTDILFVYEPRFILTDEAERLAPEHIGVLNSLMATGIVSETKHGKTTELELGTRVFAAGIKVGEPPQDLLSRFTGGALALLLPLFIRHYLRGCDVLKS